MFHSITDSILFLIKCRLDDFFQKQEKNLSYPKTLDRIIHYCSWLRQRTTINIVVSHTGIWRVPQRLLSRGVMNPRSVLFCHTVQPPLIIFWWNVSTVLKPLLSKSEPLYTSVLLGSTAFAAQKWTFVHPFSCAKQLATESAFGYVNDSWCNGAFSWKFCTMKKIYLKKKMDSNKISVSAVCFCCVF